MGRVLTIAALALGLASATALHADSKAQKCEKFSEFAGELLTLRRQGLAEMETLLAFADTHKGEKTDTLQIVASMNPWIYTLDESVTPEAVATEFNAQCQAQ